MDLWTSSSVESEDDASADPMPTTLSGTTDTSADRAVRAVRRERSPSGRGGRPPVVEFLMAPGQSRAGKGITVEIRIGIANSGRELSFETGEPADAVKKSVTDALDASAAHVSFTDVKGNSYLVPTATLAYIEFGTEESRRVGFVA
jgi:hypothetical protein